MIARSTKLCPLIPDGFVRN